MLNCNSFFSLKLICFKLLSVLLIKRPTVKEESENKETESDSTGILHKSDSTENLHKSDSTGNLPNSDSTGNLHNSDSTGNVHSSDYTVNDCSFSMRRVGAVCYKNYVRLYRDTV